MATPAPIPLAALTAFFARFDAYIAATGKEEGPVSSALFGASDRVSEIRSTKSDIGIKRLAKADAALAAMAASAGVSLPTSAEIAESDPASAGARSESEAAA